MTEFASRYGPWALIAGGAQGIGAAYTTYVAAQGLNVFVVDHCSDALDSFTKAIANTYSVECIGIHVDLAQIDMLDGIVAAVGDSAIGLLVYNAGLADVGPFYKQDTDIEFEKKKIAINVTGPMLLCHHFGKFMLTRQAGGIILMSSGAGLQGSPYYAHYSATKAYDIALAEALYGEFKPYNVDVLACIAGLTASTAADAFKHIDPALIQTPEQLVDEAINALGKQCRIIAGEMNRSRRALAQSLSQEQLVDIMAQHAIDNFFNGEIPKQNI